jgi:hypothetical protein
MELKMWSVACGVGRSRRMSPIRQHKDTQRIFLQIFPSRSLTSGETAYLLMKKLQKSQHLGSDSTFKHSFY